MPKEEPVPPCFTDGALALLRFTPDTLEIRFRQVHTGKWAAGLYRFRRK